MARRIGPDEASREVKAIVAKTFRSKDGRRAQLWSDDAATVPADVLFEDGSAIPVEQPANNGGRGSAPTVTIDGSSMLPLIQYPPGDVDFVVVTCDGGPPWRAYARTDDRLDALGGRVGTVEGVAAAAETPAGAQAKVDTLGVRVTAVETTGLAVTNLAGLKRWAAARGGALIRPVTITVLGDSISWGAGADDTDGSATPEATARARAWCSQLRKRLNTMWGLPDAEGWVSVRSGFGQSGLTTSGAVTSGSTGPYGSNGGGGMSVASGASATFTPPSSLGVFTELDVWYWGPDAGVSSPNSPTVIVDGATLATGAAVASGNLLRATVTGLAATTHTVQITRAAAGNVYFFAVTARNPTGFVTNRVAISGSTTNNIDGGLTGQGAQRLIDSAVMRGYSDLVIIALGTNDQGSQIPLATYQANLQATIDAAVAGGSAVLLLGEPPDSTPAAGITEDQYRDVMRQLAVANTHVAYTDLRTLFGTASEVSANAYGLFGAPFTVHPSAKGHGFMANALVDLLTLPRYT